MHLPYSTSSPCLTWGANTGDRRIATTESSSPSLNSHMCACIPHCPLSAVGLFLRFVVSVRIKCLFTSCLLLHPASSLASALCSILKSVVCLFASSCSPREWLLGSVWTKFTSCSCLLGQFQDCSADTHDFVPPFLQRLGPSFFSCSSITFFVE